MMPVQSQVDTAPLQSSCGITTQITRKKLALFVTSSHTYSPFLAVHTVQHIMCTKMVHIDGTVHC